MGVSPSKVAPFTSRVPIADKDGNPTPFFSRQLQQLLSEKQDVATTAANAQSTANAAVPTSQLLAQIESAMGGDPGADALMWWDHTNNTFHFLKLGTNLSIAAGVLNAAGGGGGGAGMPLLPFPSSGVATNVGSAGVSTPSMILIGAACQAATPIAGLYVPIVSAPAGLTVIPVIYDAGAISGAQPIPTGATKVADGAGVALASNKITWVPFSASFTPTVGHWYFIGLSTYGGSGTYTLGTTGANREVWYSIATYNPAPATCPAMSNTAAGWGGWWSG